MRQWPIAVDRDRDWSFIAMPSRFVDSMASGTSFVTLEALAGDAWSQRLLSRLLPPRQVWAWWTRTPVFKQSKLNSRPAPDSVDVTMLDHVQARRLLWRDMTLAFIPIGRPEWQEPVLQWAGLDTERVADQIWVAQTDTIWEPKELANWCRDESKWRLRESVAARPAEMIVLICDSCWYCACPQRSADRIVQAVHTLAAEWELEVLGDAPDRAWPAPRQELRS